jgi:hypothetical protein
VSGGLPAFTCFELDSTNGSFGAAKVHFAISGHGCFAPTPGLSAFLQDLPKRTFVASPARSNPGLTGVSASVPVSVLCPKQHCPSKSPQLFMKVILLPSLQPKAIPVVRSSASVGPQTPSQHGRARSRKRAPCHAGASTPPASRRLRSTERVRPRRWSWQGTVLDESTCI